MIFDKRLLEQTIHNETVLAFLAARGYPSGASIFAVLDYLQKQFSCETFPHEVGFFLGYPAEDVLGFMKHKGENYKLCGYWKVYGNVKKAKEYFRRYDFCRECMNRLFKNPDT
jgi:hypothetical protein